MVTEEFNEVIQSNEVVRRIFQEETAAADLFILYALVYVCIVR